MFSKILVANRGEIACRVMKTARRLGIKTVAVFSDADRNALHVEMADQALHIGGSAPADSYLQMQRIIDAAKASGCQAIHPGYGFLSENAEFCALCAVHDLVFIGPPAKAIEAMGSKSAAKQIMQDAGVPLLPGYHGDDQDEAKLKQAADDMGYPVLLKAVAGGGGKGMRQVHRVDDFSAAFAAAKREALSGFGNDAMLVEKYLERARHVEVQVFCDSYGDGVYLFERDCSVQRRHQKIVEEAPAPGVDNALRARMGEAALRAAAAVGYVGAGTVEFLLDEQGNFYFMEMNTRLQVEHPVTEMITGQDLVEWQLRVAAGQCLPLAQEQLTINGHSFEARIYAENPHNDFLPTSGQVTWIQEPLATTHVRVDSAVTVGDQVGVFYDPMIAKLIVWGEDRDSALRCLSRALSEYYIAGLTTNIDFLRQLIQRPEFRDALLSTQFIDQHRASLLHSGDTKPVQLVVLAALYDVLKKQQVDRAQTAASPWLAQDHWRLNGPQRFTLDLLLEDQQYAAEIAFLTAQDFRITVDGQEHRVSGELTGNNLAAVVDDYLSNAVVVADEKSISVFAAQGNVQVQYVAADLGVEQIFDDGNHYKAPMNGTVIDVLVSAGGSVVAGDTLIIMEAMKMEHAVTALADGTVSEVFVAKGELVDGGADLLAFAPASSPDSA